MVTFGEIWKPLRVIAPGLPVELVKMWVNFAYRRVLDAHPWSSLRVSGALYIPAPYTTGKVMLQNGSPTVTGVGTTWVDFAEKQLVVDGKAPYWDIEETVNPTELTLTSPWIGVSGTYNYSIGGYLVSFPSDFKSFYSVADVSMNWQLLETDMIRETVDLFDPLRWSTTGNPTHLLEATPGVDGKPRYELWPRFAAEKIYFFTYQKSIPDLIEDDDVLIEPIRRDVITLGALEDISMWPGTGQVENAIAKEGTTERYAARFAARLGALILEDREIRSATIRYRDDFKKLFPQLRVPGTLFVIA